MSGSSKSQDSLVLWTSIHPEIIRSTLVDRLEITGSSPLEQYTLRTLNDSHSILGIGNPASRVPTSYSPDPLKFKTYFLIFRDACFEGLNKKTVLQSLFPEVASGAEWSKESFNSLYVAFLGRKPAEAEKSVLLTLVQDASLGSNRKKAAAACMTVLNSIEFTSGR